MLDDNHGRESYINAFMGGLDIAMANLGNTSAAITARDAFLLMQIQGELDRRFAMIKLTGTEQFEQDFHELIDMARELSPTVQSVVMFGGLLWD